jgi:hypothetical protein
MMSRTRLFHRSLFLAAVVVSSSCGDMVRQGRSPVFLTIDSLTAAQGHKPTQFTGTLFSDVITNVTSPAPCSTENPCPTIFNDVGQVVLRLTPKDFEVPTTTNNQVTVTRYRVTYRRADGRNTPGVDVPYGFDGAVTGTVPASGNLTLGFEIVRHSAKQESPLVQLIRASAIINTITEVTFYGTDQVGNEISVTGQILIDFGNFGD